MPKEMHLAARNSRGEELLYHENPYPPANVVELFESYNPGSAKTLLEMAREDQRNAFELSNRKSKTQHARAWFGFVLTGLFIVCGTFLLYTDHWIGGSVSVVVALLGLVGTITTGEQPRKKT